MRTIGKRVLAVCMAALLLIPGPTVSAEETPMAETVNEVEISAAVSGGDADDDIASGVDGNITWVIDAGGKLTVEGTGDLTRTAKGIPAWGTYSSRITSAVINVTGMTNASDLFYGCDNMTSLDVSGFDTAYVTGMRHMFSGCSSLTSLDVSGFDTGNVIDMWYMFSGCSSLTSLDVSGFDTSRVTNMGFMFRDCSGLTSLDLKDFDTGRVTNMRYMFYNCGELTSLDVSGFDTGNVTDMRGMFCDCSGLTSLDVSGFDTGRVTDMGDMFSDCSGLTSLDVSGFDTSRVTDMSYMFSGCSSLTTLHSPYNVNDSVFLPYASGTVWHLPDGTKVTELPQGMNYSVTLSRNITNDNSNNGSNNNNSSNILPAEDNTQQDFIVYMVERGDSLWKIATKFYGQGYSWRRIYEDNATLIKNPGRIYEGQRLVIRLTDTIATENASETSVSASGTEALEGTVYEVLKGDSLWSIARRVYGDGRLWNIIYEANKDVIADPNRIREGQEIIIPKR